MTRLLAKNKSIMARLEAEEKRIRKTLLADAEDFEELQSDWQERDSPAERNLRYVEWHQYSSLNNELSEIDDAKQRLAAGSYGICENCGDEISPTRLSAIPVARNCITCQGRIDSGSET